MKSPRHSPLVSKGLIGVIVQSARRGKHNGGVKVTNDAADCGCCVDAGLGAT